MNQTELYLILMVQPLIFMLMSFMTGMTVVVLTNRDELMECVAKTFAVTCIIGAVYEIGVITYVCIIKLIN